MLEGFRYAEFNNIESFKEQVDSSVAAIMIETIQGEGGIFPPKMNFSKPYNNFAKTMTYS